MRVVNAQSFNYWRIINWTHTMHHGALPETGDIQWNPTKPLAMFSGELCYKK